jgi:hypothetical protein
MCPGKQVRVLSIGSLTWMALYEIINNYSSIFGLLGKNLPLFGSKKIFF